MRFYLLIFLVFYVCQSSFCQGLPDGFFRVCLSQDPISDGAAGIKELFWQDGAIINIKFIGERDVFLEEKVKEYSILWTDYADLKFNFIEEGIADIKVSFQNDGSSWSKLGTSCRQSFPNEATMNFGWFNQSTPEDEFKRTILHEFGHAIGLIHEHQNPAASIKWETDEVYKYYARFGWSKEMVDLNIFQKYDYNFVNATDYDKESIMHYPIDSGLTEDGYSVGWNAELSKLDKEFVSRIYPKKK